MQNTNTYLFTSEVVAPGHPDKCADIIADSIVDAHIIADDGSRVAIYVFVAEKNVIIGGDIKSKIHFSEDAYKHIVKNALIKIGYDGKSSFSNAECLYPEEVSVQVLLNREEQVLYLDGDEVGLSEQGTSFGYASVESENYMPAAVSYARTVTDHIYDFARDYKNALGVDIKAQVTLDYGDKDNFAQCKPQRIQTIDVLAPAVSDMNLGETQILVKQLIDEVGLPEDLYSDEKTIVKINQHGKFVKHSPLRDSGVTGRKVVEDSFGGYAPIGGGAQSSKDYSKLDRLGHYAARWIAKHIVAAGLAKKCQVQLSYAAGVSQPTSVTVDTEGTFTKWDDSTLATFVMEQFPLTPRWIIEKFKLDQPSIETFLYADVAARGQVGRDDYPWEKLDALKVFEDLRKK